MHAVKGELVGFTGKVKLPETDTPNAAFQIIVSSLYVFPPIVVGLPGKSSRNIWPMPGFRPREAPGENVSASVHQPEQGMPPVPLMLVPGPASVNDTLSP